MLRNNSFTKGLLDIEHLFDDDWCMNLASLLDGLTTMTVPDTATGPAVYDTTRTLIRIRNVVDHQLVAHAAALGRLHVADSHGRTLRTLLISMGLAPAVAGRVVRIADGIPALEKLAGHTRDGTISGEHADALVQGMTHIEARSPVELDVEQRLHHEMTLLSQVFSGATPAEIRAHARGIGNQIAADGVDDGEGVVVGLPAAEDSSINEVSWTQTSDGRIEVRGDIDIVVGEKFISLVDWYAAPRPQIDGSPDPRTAAQRHADALEHVLDIAAHGFPGSSGGGGGGGELVATPRTSVTLTVPAQSPEDARLTWTGPVSAATALRISCDGTVTTAVLDGNLVPIQMSAPHRLFPHLLRKALILRDEVCVGCGAPASHTQAHHIQPWAEGGVTAVCNGCLLCQTCHTAVHHKGWQVFIGHDGHPWLIPPATDEDPNPQPRPAYNRRTLTLDDIAA